MTTWVLPTRTDLDHYSEQVVLDDVTYTLDLRWNRRAERWFLAISDADGPIVSGMKVIVDRPLLTHVGSSRKPPGVLMALDTSGAGEDPGIDELGDRVLLMYDEA